MGRGHIGVTVACCLDVQEAFLEGKGIARPRIPARPAWMASGRRPGEAPGKLRPNAPEGHGERGGSLGQRGFPSRKGGPLPALRFRLGCVPTRRRRKRRAAEAVASGVDLRAMPLHKVPPRLWDSLRLQRGILARLPPHYLRALREDAAAPPPAVHWRPPAGEYVRRPGPLEGVRQQVVPVPVYFPPESQEGLWGGEGWVEGYRYAHDDKVGPRPRAWSRPGALAPLSGGGLLRVTPLAPSPSLVPSALETVEEGLEAADFQSRILQRDPRQEVENCYYHEDAGADRQSFWL